MDCQQNGDQISGVSRFKVILSQVVACLSLNLLLIDLGVAISFVTIVLPEVLHAKEGISLNEWEASWFGSMAFLCQPLGSVFSGPILDHFGRKRALFLVNIPHLFAWVLMSFAWNFPTLLLANALLGIGTGIMEGPCVTYSGEVSEASIRGTLATLTSGCTSTGVFLAYFLGKILPWRTAALACLAVPLLSMTLVILVPETPIWLLSKGRSNEALKSLCRLRGWVKPEYVKKEFQELVEYNENVRRCIICLKNANNDCNHKKESIIKRMMIKLKYVFLVKETLRPFLLVMAYFFFHSMSGLGPIRPNMINVCRALNMKYDPKKIVVVIGFLFIVMNIICAFTVKLIGKRKLVVFSMFATACSSTALSVYASFNVDENVFSYDPSTFPEGTEIVPVILFILLACATGCGLPWVLLSEVFPFRSRGIATGLSAALVYVIFFIATKTNFDLESNLHLSGTFALYALFGFMGCIYLYLYLPETENKTLIEIESYFKGEYRIFADDCFVNYFINRRNKPEKERNVLMQKA